MFYESVLWIVLFLSFFFCPFLPWTESLGYFQSLCTCAVDSSLFISIRAVIVIILDTNANNTENWKWEEKQAICHVGGGAANKI